jgi:pimeloyl-ACP methyl ester carboxylesterase
MPEVERPDGARIHWAQRGSGPTVALANLYNGPPSLLEGLIAELSRDHTVVTYDLRGNGASSRTGPYDIETDAGDLGAVIEAAGAPAVVVGLGDGGPRAVRLAAAREDLVRAVVISGVVPLGRGAGGGGSGLSGSRSVLEAMAQMYDVDHRAAVRSTVGSGNPGLTEEQVRERVEAVVAYSEQASGATRLRSWIADDASAPAAAIGDRLWVLAYGGNPWFPAEAAERMQEMLPQAHFETVEDGAMTRPDLTAAVVRRITGG